MKLQTMTVEQLTAERLVANQLPDGADKIARIAELNAAMSLLEANSASTKVAATVSWADSFISENGKVSGIRVGISVTDKVKEAIEAFYVEHNDEVVEYEGATSKTFTLGNFRISQNARGRYYQVTIFNNNLFKHADYSWKASQKLSFEIVFAVAGQESNTGHAFENTGIIVSRKSITGNCLVNDNVENVISQALAYIAKYPGLTFDQALSAIKAMAK